jgi:glutamine---fructose-6-phosphate transaminase (isomerizing)
MNAAQSPPAEYTRMFQEAATASDAVRAQLHRDAEAIAAIGRELRRLEPRTVITCARGSSDHAATYGKYLIETRAGIVTASAAPSVSSIYGASQDLRGSLFIVLSQSGRSPDLLASVAAAKAAGALVLPTANAGAEIAPILLVQSAYRLIATLAVRRGFDPDHPAHLLKVTETM